MPKAFGVYAKSKKFIFILKQLDILHRNFGF